MESPDQQRRFVYQGSKGYRFELKTPDINVVRLSCPSPGKETSCLVLMHGPGEVRAAMTETEGVRFYSTPAPPMHGSWDFWGCDAYNRTTEGLHAAVSLRQLGDIEARSVKPPAMDDTLRHQGLQWSFISNFDPARRDDILSDSMIR